MFGGPNSVALNQNAVIGWDRTSSPRIVNELRIGFNRFNVVDTANSYGVNENNNLGIPNGNIPGLAYTSGIAQFNIAGFAVSGGPGLTGDPGWTDAKRVANIFEYSDGLTWVKGKHNLKFGADIQQMQSTLTNSQDDPRGIFNFNANYTSNAGAPGTGAPARGRADRLGRRAAEGLARTMAPLRLGRDDDGQRLLDTIELDRLLGVDDPMALDLARLWRPRPLRERHPA